MIEEARVLQLHLVVATQNHRDEKLQENQRHYKHIADKEYKSTCPTAAANHLPPVIRIVLI